MEVYGARFVLKHGDITKERVDAIVNAANSGLLGGGGVDGSIHRAGGPAILRECRDIASKSGPCPPGQAVITGAGLLDAKFVIHAVGPRWRGGHSGERDFLRSAYQNSLLLAVHNNVRSIAFPAISTGAYGYPADEASEVALSACADFVKVQAENGIEEIRFILFSESHLRIYSQTFERL